MTDLSESLRFDLNNRERDGLLRRPRVVTTLPDGWCEIDGRRLRNFAGNDYLGLTHDDRVIAAAKAVLDEQGVGSSASALVCGRSEWHERLEVRMAQFEKQEAAILFPSGYAANIGVISALATADDVLFCDRFNHASLVDGCRLSQAKLRVYRHDDLQRLKRELNKAAGYRRRWIVSDSLFSMDGDFAPLAELSDLAHRFDAELILDEAHGTGVYGEHGRGVAEELGVEERIAVRIGTLSKAVGALGGFVAGGQTLIDFLFNHAKTQIYSTALPGSICAAACTAIGLIREERFRRQHLRGLSAHLREALMELALDVPGEKNSPIVPVIIGDADQAVSLSRQLEVAGFLVPAIRPPTVPRNTSRLRISLSSAHSEADIDTLTEAIRRLISGRENSPMLAGRKGAS